MEDLQIIHGYIAKDSKRYAERFVEKLIERVDQPEKYPISGRIVPEFDSPLIRELIERNYRIIYKCSAKQVAILRVHHAARQLNKNFIPLLRQNPICVPGNAS